MEGPSGSTHPHKEVLQQPLHQVSAPSASWLVQSMSLSFPSIAECQILKKRFDNANVFSNDEPF